MCRYVRQLLESICQESFGCFVEAHRPYVTLLTLLIAKVEKSPKRREPLGSCQIRIRGLHNILLKLLRLFNTGYGIRRRRVDGSECILNAGYYFYGRPGVLFGYGDKGSVLQVATRSRRASSVRRLGVVCIMIEMSLAGRCHQLIARRDVYFG